MDNYLPIQSLDIEAEKRITFDLFLNLPLNDRVILYRRKGGALESSKLAAFAESNVQSFWIRKEDYNEFVKYVAARLKTLVDKPDQPGGKQMMVSAAKAILSSTFSSSSSAMVKALMGNLNEITGVLIESVLENISTSRKQAFRNLVAIADKGTDFHKHPVNVTSISVLIAFGIGYSTDKILAEVAMGALLHDIGLAKVPPRVANSAHDPMLLDRNERALLYQHGQLGLQILEEKKIKISEIVRAIITQHHEQFNGFGYPNALRGYVVNEFAQIVHVADEIDQIVRDEGSLAENLRTQLTRLFDQYTADKVIDPALANRIRRLFF